MNDLVRASATEPEIWSCEDGQIRVTPAGQPSVFDMIKVLGGQKNPHQVWVRLTESHPEVLPKCENLRFPGRGQRETPVVKDKEAAYYILGLLPGAAGKHYREQAAKLFVAYLENPAQLAGELVERMSGEDTDWLEARLNAKRTRHTFTNELKEFGVERDGYGRCTNAIYRPILGKDAKTMKLTVAEKTHRPVKSINPRDHMTIQELHDVESAERIAVGQLRRTSAHGNNNAERVVKASAEYTRKLLDGEITIPGL